MGREDDLEDEMTAFKEGERAVGRTKSTNEERLKRQGQPSQAQGGARMQLIPVNCTWCCRRTRRSRKNPSNRTREAPPNDLAKCPSSDPSTCASA